MIRMEYERIKEEFCTGNSHIVDIYRLTEYIDSLHRAIWAHKKELIRLVGSGNNIGNVHRLLWDLVEDYKKLGD